MQSRLVLAVAIGLTLIIRLTLLAAAPDISYDAYHTLHLVQHIADTGMPLYSTDSAWGGARYTYMPLFYYLLAFSTILLPDKFALLIFPNIFMSAVPLLVYMIATQVSRDERPALIAALASVFVPLAYSETVVSAHPITLALPLLLLTYYYFLRLGRSPKDQLPFLVTVVALTLTHPISLVLIPAMALSVLLIRIQRTRFSHAMAEAALFTTVLMIWASLVFYKTALTAHGWGALWAGTAVPAGGIAAIAAAIGVVPLLLGAWASYEYLRQERSGAVHVVFAAALAVAALTAVRLLPLDIGLLVLGTFLCVLVAPAMELLGRMRSRSRWPSVYVLGFAALALLFVTTSAVPSIAAGIEALADTPSREERLAVEALARAAPGTVTHWDARHGYLLEAHGLRTVVNRQSLAHPRSATIAEEMSNISDTRSEIRLVELLNDHAVRAVVFAPGEAPGFMSSRCFPLLANYSYEVYHVRCVVQ